MMTMGNYAPTTRADEVIKLVNLYKSTGTELTPNIVIDFIKIVYGYQDNSEMMKSLMDLVPTILNGGFNKEESEEIKDV